MARGQARTTGLERERLRRQKVDLQKSQELAARAENASESTHLPAWSSTTTAGKGNASADDRTRRRFSATGVRSPGQQVPCGWCGEAVVVKSRGPIPKWCSSSCRHRAWEQVRASRSGRVALKVVDRYVTALPRSTDAWLDQLDALATQVRGGDLDRPLIYIALEVVLAKIREQEQGHPDDDRW